MNAEVSKGLSLDSHASQSNRSRRKNEKKSLNSKFNLLQSQLICPTIIPKLAPPAELPAEDSIHWDSLASTTRLCSRTLFDERETRAQEPGRDRTENMLPFFGTFSDNPLFEAFEPQQQPLPHFKVCWIVLLR